MTFSPDSEDLPGWYQGARKITFTVTRGQSQIFMRPADGTGEPVPLAQGNMYCLLDGVPWMAIVRYGSPTGQDIYYQPVDGSDSAQVFLATNANEVGPEISPDGRFLCYMSNEAGRNEIYLKPFPTGSGKWQVSTEGGAWPVWSRDGKEILYREGADASGRMISVSVETEPHVILGAPTELFNAGDAPYLNFQAGARRYDTTHDPDLLLMLELVNRSEGAESRLVFCENWVATYRSAGN